jgi:hypothetical protein
VARADRGEAIRLDLNISSQMGHVGAAKAHGLLRLEAAMEGFTKAMAIELARTTSA